MNAISVMPIISGSMSRRRRIISACMPSGASRALLRLGQDEGIDPPLRVVVVVADASASTDVYARLDDHRERAALHQVVLCLAPQVGALAVIGLDVDLVA